MRDGLPGLWKMPSKVTNEVHLRNVGDLRHFFFSPFFERKAWIDQVLRVIASVRPIYENIINIHKMKAVV